MVLTLITLILVLVGVAAYFIGAIKLAKYGFRLGTGTGLAVIFFPPYTFYFALKKLEVDGKELPTALVSFGLISSTLLILIFWQPLMLLATFQFDELDRLMERDKAPQGVVLLDEQTARDLSSDDDEVAAAAADRVAAAQREEAGLPAEAEENAEPEAQDGAEEASEEESSEEAE